MMDSSKKLVVHFYEQIDKLNGKMGHGVLRYSRNPITSVIDFNHGGCRTRDILDFGPDVPIFSSVEEAMKYGGEVLVLGMAPSGGRMPLMMNKEIDDAIGFGMSIVNGLHERIRPKYSTLQGDQWIWDIRCEPQDLKVGSGQAMGLKNRRVLMVGTDMAVGKMTAGLELWHAALKLGIDAEFLATGQIGILISGSGVPLDAIRVDYACGAIEEMVVNAGNSQLSIIEGQGSILHPGSASTLPLIRGSCPTHLILCHRAGMSRLDTTSSQINVPPLDKVIRLYEDLASACGSYINPDTTGIAVNTSHLSKDHAQDVISDISQQTGLLVVDPVRGGADRLVRSIMS